MNVLIADDSKEVRSRIEKIISEKIEVNKVYQAGNTQDALQRFRTNSIDLIILDISMPGKGGIHVLEQIRKENTNVTIIMFTNYPYPQFRKKCMELGADNFFDKSDYVDMIDLLNKIFLGHQKNK